MCNLHALRLAITLVESPPRSTLFSPKVFKKAFPPLTILFRDTVGFTVFVPGSEQKWGLGESSSPPRASSPDASSNSPGWDGRKSGAARSVHLLLETEVYCSPTHKIF
ncbi:hypothetical protein JTE90_016253 [Oedothorax gibbosus]|uniref:Uncharacterized protein n=1 Tax=Oedothorax gibbosus TaxID=931172 RepID=A0AAV6VST0_9ARAC|nr:hypothetical protein JTE90_016253 [Oedothorax gibbosus]